MPRNLLNYAFASASRFLLLFLLVLAGRYLGIEDFGIFSFALAFVFLFEPILDPGLYHLLVREVARDRGLAERYLAHALSWKFAVAPLFVLVGVGAVNLIHSSSQILQAVYLMMAACFFKSVKDAFRSILLSYEYFGLDAVSLAVERLALLIAGGWILISGRGLLSLCWTFALVRAVDLCVIAAMVRVTACRVSLGWDASFVRKMIVAAFPIGAFYITLNVYNYIDTVMLSMFRGSAEVGWYNASYRIYEGLIIVPATMGTVFLPRLSLLYKQGTAQFASLVCKGTKYVCVVALAIAANGLLLSGEVVELLFGADYERSVVTLNVLLVGVLFVFALNFLQTVAISMDAQKVILRLALVGLFGNVAANAFLIPEFGYVGAAIATVAVEGVVFVFLWSYVQRTLEATKWWQVFGKPVTSLLIPFSAIWLFIPAEFVYVRVVLTNFGFVACLHLMRVFDREEIARISSAIALRAKQLG